MAGAAVITGDGWIGIMRQLTHYLGVVRCDRDEEGRLGADETARRSGQRRKVMDGKDLVRRIKEVFGNPQSWVDAGLGHNTVAKVDAWIDERARNLAQSLLADIVTERGEVEGWANEETWQVWTCLVNKRVLYEQATDATKGKGDAEVFALVFGPLFEAELRAIAMRRVDWKAIVEELRRRESGT